MLFINYINIALGQFTIAQKLKKTLQKYKFNLCEFL